MSSNDFQSGGIEGSKGLFAMSGTPTSPPDPSMYPWNWCDGAGAIDLSPASSISSSNDSPDFRRDLKRGRPRADAITTLIVEGTRVNSDIRCKICNRVFPRDKSLQAHMRTHTGERPYRCDYPGCDKFFCQSGQLKTHQRLHTGEKPFLCSVSGCSSRFAHANRHCPDHPRATLRRDHTSNFTPSKTEQSPEVQFWLDRHLQKRQERTPNRPTRSRTTKRSLNLYHDEENQPTSFDAKQLQFSTPPPKKLGTEFHYSRESVIKQAKTDGHDLKWEENDMGVRRLQPLQTTPLKTSPNTRHLAPLQNVPLNLASPVEMNSVQQNKTLPLPLVPQSLTVLENAPKNTSHASDILPFQKRSIAYLPHSGVIDICNGLVPSTSKHENIQSCFTTPPRKVPKRTTEERDMLIGALALVELSQSPQ